MKQPSDTVPPLVGDPSRRRSILELFRPEHRRDAFYEGQERGGGLYLLWMECSRFGVLMAYPCVLREEGAEPMVFASGAEDESEQNAALIRRWEELDVSGMADRLEITPLDQQEFKKRYKSFLMN